jgi:hypothetical protein
MKEIIIGKMQDRIGLDNVNPYAAIFAKGGDGKVIGMISRQRSTITREKGYVLKTGSERAATGYHKTLRECIESCIPHGITFFVNEDG